MSILITGGAGLLGSSLAKELINQGYNDIVLFDVQPNYKLGEDILKKAKVIMGDITLWTDLTNVIATYEVDEVFHLAAILSSESEQNPTKAFRINVEGTVNLLEISRMNKVKHVIFPSTIATYGPDVIEPVDEKQRQEPTNIYGVTKVACELWGLYYYRRYGVDFRAVRFCRLVNPGREGGGAASFPSLMIQKAALGEPYESEVQDDYRIPLIYMKDAVNALFLLFKAEEVKTRIYNLSGLAPTAREILNIIKKYIPDCSLRFPAKKTVSHLQIPLRYEDSKAREELGWAPKFNLEEMIKDFVEEVKTGKYNTFK
jgi:nucleoside-diphosphate-sugar epimerase